MRWLATFAAIIGVLESPAFAQTQIPHQLNVQGVLRNVSGEVVTGSYPMTFRLYTAQSGGTLLMTYTTPTPVTVTGGIFSVDVTISQNFFSSNPAIWLELQVGTDAPLPRRQITSVGYAYKAEIANQCVELTGPATDLDCSGDGCVDSTELAPAIVWARGRTAGGAAADVDCENPLGCITTAEIVDLSVGTNDIANSAVNSSKLASDLTLAGNTTTSNLLVKGYLYSGADFSASNIRLDSTGALRNITTLTMSGQLTNTVATGAPPFVVSSATTVTNLSADLLDGQHGAFYLNASNLNSGTVPTARLPIATTSTVGVVKVGTGLSVAADGTLSSTAGGVGPGTAGRVPRFATSTTLGDSTIQDNGGGATAGLVSIGAAAGDFPYKLFVAGDLGVSEGKEIIARYNTTGDYRGSLRWNSLQLGNGGSSNAANYIVAGRTAAGGGLRIYVNNTNNVDTRSSVLPNGVEAMTIRDNGNVGIGVDPSATKLHVRLGAGGEVTRFETASGMVLLGGSDASGYYLRQNGPASGVPAPHVLRLETSDGGAQMTQLFIDGTTRRIYTYPAEVNLGVGTATPAAKLDVNGEAIASYVSVRAQDGATEGGEIRLIGAGSYPTWLIDGYANQFRLHSGGTVYLSVDRGLTPARLSAPQVQGIDSLCIGAQCRNAWPDAGSGSGYRAAKWAGLPTETNSKLCTADLIYYPDPIAGTPGAGVTEGVAVGYTGTPPSSSPAAEMLHVYGAATAEGRIYSREGDGRQVYLRQDGLIGDGPIYFRHSYNSSFAMAEINLRNDLPAGLSTDPRYAEMWVHGDVRVGNEVYGTSGCLRNRTGGTITGTCPSDERFKRDVRPFEPMLDRVARLRPVKYHWRSDENPSMGFGNDLSWGLVAQDVEQVMPELVENSSLGYKTVHYHYIPLVLLQAVRELKEADDKIREKVVVDACPKGFAATSVTLCDSASAGGSAGCSLICQGREQLGTFQQLEQRCAAAGGHICTYGELYALASGNGTSVCPYARDGWHIGNRTNDDEVMVVTDCGNLDDFEGVASKNDLRWGRCCRSSAAPLP